MNIPKSELEGLPEVVRREFVRWDDFLASRMAFNRPQSTIHAFGHCERVLLYALIIGEKIFGDGDPEALEILAQAAVFHDTRRVDDYLDTGHGARAAVYYEDFCRRHPDAITFHPETVYLMRYHDLDDARGIEAVRRAFGDDAERVILLYQIFKDADALDRWRLGHLGLDPRYLRTDPAKTMTDYSRGIVEATVPPDILRATSDEVERIIAQQKSHPKPGGADS